MPASSRESKQQKYVADNFKALLKASTSKKLKKIIPSVLTLKEIITLAISPDVLESVLVFVSSVSSDLVLDETGLIALADKCQGWVAALSDDPPITFADMYPLLARLSDETLNAVAPVTGHSLLLQVCHMRGHASWIDEALFNRLSLETLLVIPREGMDKSSLFAYLCRAEETAQLVIKRFATDVAVAKQLMLAPVAVDAAGQPQYGYDLIAQSPSLKAAFLSKEVLQTLTLENVKKHPRLLNQVLGDRALADEFIFTADLAWLRTYKSAEFTPELLCAMLARLENQSVMQLLSPSDSEPNMFQKVTEALAALVRLINEIANGETVLLHLLKTEKLGEGLVIKQKDRLFQLVKSETMVRSDTAGVTPLLLLVDKFWMCSALSTNPKLTAALTVEKFYQEVGEKKTSIASEVLALRDPLPLLLANDAKLLALLQPDDVAQVVEQADAGKLADTIAAAMKTEKAFERIERALFKAGRIDLMYAEAEQKALANLFFATDDPDIILDKAQRKRLLQYLGETGLNCCNATGKSVAHYLLDFVDGVNFLTGPRNMRAKLSEMTLAICLPSESDSLAEKLAALKTSPADLPTKILSL